MNRNNDPYQPNTTALPRFVTSFFSINGRISLFTLILRCLVIIGIMFVLQYLSDISLFKEFCTKTDFKTIVLFLAVILTIIQCIKRMHDVNRSAWYLLFPGFNFVLLTKEGSNGPNKYGKDPRPINNIEFFDQLELFKQMKQNKGNLGKHKPKIFLVGLVILLFFILLKIDSCSKVPPIDPNLQDMITKSIISFHKNVDQKDTQSVLSSFLLPIIYEEEPFDPTDTTLLKGKITEDLFSKMESMESKVYTSGIKFIPALDNGSLPITAEYDVKVKGVGFDAQPSEQTIRYKMTFSKNNDDSIKIVKLKKIKTEEPVDSPVPVDNDDDGVEDANDICAGTPPEVIILNNGCALREEDLFTTSSRTFPLGKKVAFNNAAILKPYTIELGDGRSFNDSIPSEYGYTSAGQFTIKILQQQRKLLSKISITTQQKPHDCPYRQQNFGDFCDDGNASTENDRVQTDCQCRGVVKEKPQYDYWYPDNDRDGNGDSNSSNRVERPLGVKPSGGNWVQNSNDECPTRKASTSNGCPKITILPIQEPFINTPHTVALTSDGLKQSDNIAWETGKDLVIQIPNGTSVIVESRFVGKHPIYFDLSGEDGFKSRGSSHVVVKIRKSDLASYLYDLAEYGNHGVEGRSRTLVSDTRAAERFFAKSLPPNENAKFSKVRGSTIINSQSYKNFKNELLNTKRSIKTKIDPTSIKVLDIEYDKDSGKIVAVKYSMD